METSKTLKLKSNCCSEHMKIHPIKGGTWCLQPAAGMSDHSEDHEHISLICFDKRQTWDVYYYRFADTSGWVAARSGMYLRIPEKIFEYFFGKWEVEI